MSMLALIEAFEKMQIKDTLLVQRVPIAEPEGTIYCFQCFQIK